jgi:hypothetical protein
VSAKLSIVQQYRYQETTTPDTSGVPLPRS